MPTYSYFCQTCKTHTERLVKIDERNKQTCECGRQLYRKVDRPGAVWAPTSTGGGMKV